METTIGLLFAVLACACVGAECVDPLPLEPDSCDPYGFSCTGADEWESEQLALECDAIGGYCAGDGEPRPAQCPAPEFSGPHCMPRAR